MANDIDYYIEHVHRIIPRAFQQSETEHERNDRTSHLCKKVFPTHVPSVLAKAVTLIQSIIDQGRDREAFHLFILLKTEMRETRSRVRGRWLHEAHETSDKMMGAFSTQIPIERGARSHIVVPDGHLNVRLELQGLHWRQLDDVRGKHNEYWDFAGAARNLQRAYTEKLCTGAKRSRGTRVVNPGCPCFHTRSADLLEWLQTKAWSEIRARVFQAVGPYLPPEITEDVFEFALVAEGIPLHPRLEEKASVSASDLAGLVSQPPRQAKRLKAEYRCGHVERMRGC